MLASYDCSTCTNTFMRERGQANRTLKRSGGFIFCSSECFGIHHRSNKTSEQKKAEKAVYDKAYRQENLADITAKKAAYHKATYDPAEARIKRKKIMPRHVQYCRSPAYRAYKLSISIEK